MPKNFHKNKYNSGMTLIELLVVVFIFMIITSITIFSYGKFNSSLSVQNLADDIALSIRKTQGYAIGVRGFNSFFSEGYGIHFSTNTDVSNPSSGSNGSFVLFANMGGNNDDEYNYDSSPCGNPSTSNECLEVLNIKSSDKILEFYVGTGGGKVLISNGMLDIFFKRPNPEPTFCVRNGTNTSSACDYSSSVSYVEIKIKSGGTPAVYKTITISNNGQISVSN